MKIAVVDLGTNTFNLLIRDTESGMTLSNTKLAVSLGKGGLTSGKIMPDAFDRGLEAMITHRTTAADFGADRILAFATSAVRDAANGLDFVDAIREATGIEVEVIDGMREAELIFKGVRQAVPMDDDPVLVMDIGGGSTEFILGNHEEVFWAESYNLGASRLREKFQPEDPISQAQIREIREYAGDMVTALAEACRQFPPKTLIGSSGSFDTLYDILELRHGRAPLQSGQVSGVFDEGELRILIRNLLEYNIEERLSMPGMLAIRAEILHISGILIHCILDLLTFEQIRLSTYSLKEGVIAEILKH